ncbi:MAG: hypothetical protein DRR06_15835 [Gammaproteobacteria bacterium]|nr:MAG: hypothetical protein DRR06_15835 [Gammaproteobacteria bacterium]
MSEKLTFIGPPKVDGEERSILRIFGNALRYMDITLITSPRGEGNGAVIEGYEEFGGEPTLKPGKVLDETTDALLVYTDLEHELIRTLDSHFPTWRRNTPEPTIVQGKSELTDYVYAALAAIKIAELENDDAASRARSVGTPQQVDGSLSGKDSTPQ